MLGLSQWSLGSKERGRAPANTSHFPQRFHLSVCPLRPLVTRRPRHRDLQIRSSIFLILPFRYPPSSHHRRNLLRLTSTLSSLLLLLLLQPLPAQPLWHPHSNRQHVHLAHGTAATLPCMGMPHISISAAAGHEPPHRRGTHPCATDTLPSDRFSNSSDIQSSSAAASLPTAPPTQIPSWTPRTSERIAMPEAAGGGAVLAGDNQGVWKGERRRREVRS